MAGFGIDASSAGNVATFVGQLVEDGLLLRPVPEDVALTADAKHRVGMAKLRPHRQIPEAQSATVEGCD